MEKPPSAPKHLYRVSAPAISLLERQSAASNSGSRFESGLGKFSVDARLHAGKNEKGLARSSLQKTAEHLENRSEFHTKVTLNIQVLSAERNEHVVYKSDGSRFQEGETTIKVASGEVYRIGVSTKPEEVVVDGGMLMLRITGGGLSRDDSILLDGPVPGQRGTWGMWKCELPVSKKSDRVILMVSGKLADFGEFYVPLMLKVYKSNDKRLRQGLDLKQLGCDLKRVGDGGETKLVSTRYA